jgi:ATP-binding cassette subfamily F protein 3
VSRESHSLRLQDETDGSSGFNLDARWGHRAGEPHKAVVCSVALARHRDENDAKGMAGKLLLFWRKPARRCWWEGVQLQNVDGVEGKLKVWVRRVWTLEMVSLYMILLPAADLLTVF